MDAILSYERNEDEDYYKILGCDELSTVNQITAEYKAKVLSCHPDKNPGNAEAAARFEKLQKAKDVLGDEKKRKDYDLWRRSGLAMSYKDWCAKRDSMHTSLHWAVVTKKDPMIEPTPDSSGTFRGCCDLLRSLDQRVVTASDSNIKVKDDF